MKLEPSLGAFYAIWPVPQLLGSAQGKCHKWKVMVIKCSTNLAEASVAANADWLCPQSPSRPTSESFLRASRAALSLASSGADPAPLKNCGGLVHSVTTETYSVLLFYTVKQLTVGYFQIQLVTEFNLFISFKSQQQDRLSVEAGSPANVCMCKALNILEILLL